jgi:putative ABC transport system permease protein
MVARRIDALFANSAYETITETEKAFNQGFASMFGNIQLLTLLIGAAVVIAILMVAANTMAMVARERGRDVAILKTLGFQGRQVFFLILAESTLVALVGGVIGCVLGVWMIGGMSRVPMIANLLGGLNFNPMTAAYALTICLLIGLFSGYLPGRQAARLSVVEALRRIT